jgi:hypothetical protein
VGLQELLEVRLRHEPLASMPDPLAQAKSDVRALEMVFDEQVCNLNSVQVCGLLPMTDRSVPVRGACGLSKPVLLRNCS